MMSPLKLSVIVCGAAAGLAVAPYMVKQILPEAGTGAAPVVAENAIADKPGEPIDVKLDLPVAGQNTVAETPAVQADIAPPAIQVAAATELSLPQPVLPTPEPTPAVTPKTAADLTLPSLNADSGAIASLPAPAAATSTPTPTPTPRPTPVPTPALPHRADVETAQNLMKKLGIDTGKIDGKLGPNTQAAIRKYQKENGLDETGEVDSRLIASMEGAVSDKEAAEAKKAEEARLAAEAKKAEEEIAKADDPDTVVVRKSSEKSTEVSSAAKPKADPGPVPTLNTMDDVRKLQERLKAAGTYEGDVDGKWGDLTRTAMREFQEKAGVEVTGRPNRETWNAMHADEMPVVETAASNADDSDSDMEISSTKSRSSSDDVVVKVNGDGSSKPDARKPLPTPAAVSDMEESDEKDSKPRVEVAVPKSESEKRERSDLAVAEGDGEDRAATSGSERPRAEIRPVSNNPGELSREAKEKQSKILVDGVRKSYRSLKDNFDERIKVLSTKDEDEKALREDYTQLVSKIDDGFTAMDKDYKDKKYDPILENAEGFQSTIDQVNEELAAIYVKAKMEDSDVKKKLDKKKTEELEGLVKKEEHLKAAETLDKIVSR